MTPNKPLVFYINPSWRREGIHTTLLNPWWGNPYPESAIFAKEMFDTYLPDTEYYAITDDIQIADMVLVPYRHNWLLRFDQTLLTECINTAEHAGLPILIDGMGDIENPVNTENTYILRYSGYRFLPSCGRIQLPLTVDDLLERTRGGTLEIRKKREGRPVVGFAGWTDMTFKQYLRTIIKELPVRMRGIFDARYRACTKGVLWRQKAIQILQKSPEIVFNLLARKSFSANPKTAEGDMQQLREEMVATILHSDYALDVRGDGNNSARLFEILSLGRIPVIVDTERILPFADKIDYSSFALIVDFRDIKHLPERIAEFHKNVSPERFEEMQRNARDAFVRYFRIDAFMRPLIEELRAKIALPQPHR